MAAFLALYSGRSIGEAKMVAVTADPELVSAVAAHLLDTPHSQQDDDPAVVALERGRRAALRVIKREASHAEG